MLSNLQMLLKLPQKWAIELTAEAISNLIGIKFQIKLQRQLEKQIKNQ